MPSCFFPAHPNQAPSILHPGRQQPVWLWPGQIMIALTMCMPRKIDFCLTPLFASPHRRITTVTLTPTLSLPHHQRILPTCVQTGSIENRILCCLCTKHQQCIRILCLRAVQQPGVEGRRPTAQNPHPPVGCAARACSHNYPAHQPRRPTCLEPVVRPRQTSIPRRPAIPSLACPWTDARAWTACGLVWGVWGRWLAPFWHTWSLLPLSSRAAVWHTPQ